MYPMYSPHNVVSSLRRNTDLPLLVQTATFDFDLFAPLIVASI